jgi:hypothetical protein
MRANGNPPTCNVCFHDSLTIFIPTKLAEEAVVEGANLV